MSWMDEYNKAMGRSTASASANTSNWMQEYRQTMAEYEEEKKKKEEAERLKKMLAEDAKVKRESLTNEEEDDSELDFFQKGAFKDGFDWSDIPKSILGTAGDVGLEVVKGAGNMLEGVADLFNYGVAGVADLAGKEKFAEKVRKGTQRNLIDEWTKGADDYLEKYSVLGRTSDAVAQGIGQVGTILLTGGLGQAAGLGTAGVTALTTGSMGLSGMGSGMGEAYRSGATDEEAVLYGSIAGAADALSELMFGGLGKAVKATGLSTGLFSADDMLAKKVSSMFSSQLAKNLSSFGVKAAAEGFEEVVAGTAQAIGKWATYASEEKSAEELWKIVQDENLLEQFVVGAITSGIAQAPSLHTSVNSGTDFITGQTANEEAVVKKEVEKRIADQEKNGKKLTAKQKSEIEAQVERDLDKGYISTDTIEEVLGGETYQRYKSTIDSENALKEKQKALQEEFDALNKMKQGEMTGEQIDRRAELKEELAKVKESVMSAENHSAKSLLQQRLSEEVSTMVRSDRLIESYNERERRKQYFEADLTKYTNPKARQSVQNLMEAKVANNTNRTREMADTVAKLAEDKDIVFHFTNNQKLKEDGNAYKSMKEFTADGNTAVFELGTKNIDADFQPVVKIGSETVQNYKVDFENGKITFDAAPAEGSVSVEFRKTGMVNGFNDGKGNITINMDSPRYWNFIVGHEVTHSLEQAKAYEGLQKAVFAYAQAKGEYQGRYDSLKARYNEGTNIEQELTADLVGDYIFNDEAFVKDLSTNHRNIFQRIFDEIKYLLKVVTAGSKEARQLEKAKRMFEKAYREAGKAQTETEAETKYSVRKDVVDVNGKEYDSVVELDKTVSKSILSNPKRFLEYIEKNLVGLQMAVEDASGNSEIIVFAKPNETTSKNGKRHPVLGELAYTRGDTRKQVIVNAEEVVGESEYDPVYSSTNNEHGWLDKNGWESRKTHVLTQDGMIYEAYLKIAKARDGRNILYAVNLDIKKGIAVDKGATSEKAAVLAAMPSGDNVAQNGNNVKHSLSDSNDSYLSDLTIDDLLKMPDDDFYQIYEDLVEDIDLELDDDILLGYDAVESISEEVDADPEVIKILFRRNGLGNSHIDSNRKAVMTQERINQRIAEHGAGNTDYARRYITRIAPKDFIDMTVYAENMDRTNFDNRVRGDLDSKMGEWNYEKQLHDSTEPPVLVVNKATGQIIGHNGRHRVRALEIAGIESVEIEVELHDEDGSLIKYNAQTIPDMAISSQFDTAIETHISNVIPLNNAHRGEIGKYYGENAHTNSAIKFSLSDSSGRQLSGEQQEYFKDSVVRDENGNLKVMYHGTSKGGFNMFDTYGSNYGLFGTGSYFTDNKDVAQSYTNKGKGNNKQVYETYLNIKNPMDMDAQANPAQWQKAFPDADFPESGTNEQFYRAVEEFYADQWMSKWEVAEEIQAGIEFNMGYDGITHIGGGRVNADSPRHRVYIAFQPEQIKNVDNAKPTADPDIRYSLGEEVTDVQNERGLDRVREISFSLMNDAAYMDKAISMNNSALRVTADIMDSAKAVRERIAERMNAIKDRGLVGLPEDIEGNTYIANSSYDGTEENTTICPRSLAAEAFTDAVSEYLGRPLTVEEQIYISQDLQGRSLTPECTYCYVATDRKAYRAFLGEYIAQRDSVIQKVQETPDADISRSGKLYKDFLNGRKDTSPMYNRFKMWVNAYKNGKPMVEASHLANISKLMGDINSEFGAELKPQIVDAMKYAQSASWAKKRVNYDAYNGHILKWKQDRINKLNSHYGLRMYSFSDFHPAFVLENMQMITDASVRGLKMLGYTKDTDFVEIFAPTGMNINVSTFGFETGGEVFENNIIGAEWTKAKELRGQYPNVGITFVATNDNLVEWAMAQDWIDVVIPYHLVRTGAEVAKAFGYTNYTSESSDTKDSDWNKASDKKYIAPTEHNNDKATYLAALQKNHLKPRFERFLANPNYMKLVNECRQPASVSKPVQPVFNEDAAMVALAKLEANGYYQPVGGSVERMYEIAAEVAESMTQQFGPTRHSVSDPDAEYPNSSNFGAPARSLRVAFEEDIAPVREEVVVSQKETTTPATVSKEEMVEMFPDDLDPAQVELDNLLQEKEALEDRMMEAIAAEDYDTYHEVNKRYMVVSDRIGELDREEREAEYDRLDSLDDLDAPPEMDAPYYGEPSEPAVPEDPFEDRDYSEVGKRNVNAYMYENPEVKPFFQAEARVMLGDLGSSIRGEKIFNDQVYYDSGGEKGWMGTKRQTTDDIAYLLDSGYTYAEIEKGLNAIIEDNGKENNAVSKRIEFALNDRLLKGYNNVWGEPMPPDQGYIDLLNEKQINEYSQEAFERFMSDADQYAPEEDIAPVAPAAPVAEDSSAVEDIAPTYDVTGKKGVPDGQQAFMPDAGVEPKFTRKQLHQNIVDRVKASFKVKGFDFDNVLKKAKDLSTFATVDNTPQRVMEKALGYKQGQVLSDLTVNQVAKNETEGIKWLNSFTDRKHGLLAQISKQYNIKPGSKKSAAAQMYAEGFYVGENEEIIAYGDRELAMDFPNVKVQNQIKGLARDPRIRKIYDDTLASINESRTRNAYPEIPRLDNYFLHFRAMEDTFSRLGLPFNPNDIRAKDLPTDLNGVTADLKPGQPYFASAMHRTGKRTSFDLLGGLEKYLTSAKNQIYHIDDIQTLRAVRNYIAEMYGQASGLENLSELSDEEAQQRIEDVYGSHLSTFAKFLNEEANVLAGKTALIDRGLEGIIGRRGITFLNALNRQVGSNMVGYNISSSLTNFLAPVQAFAKSNKFDFVKGMAQTAANKVGSIFGRGDGFAEASPVMIRRKGAEVFYRTPWQKLADPGYVLMGAVDEISTELIARAKYNELTRKGMDSQQAHYETDKWVSRLMGDRSLGQQPQLYNSKMLGLVTKFQLEVRNQLDSQFYDTIQEAKVSSEDIQNGLLRNARKAAKITSTFVQLAVLQHLFGKAFESIAGYNPAFDIISAIIKAFGWDDEEDDEDTVLDNIEEGFFELMGDMPYVSTLTGGRIPIESALPIEELYKGEDKYGNEKSRWKTLSEAAPYYLMPGGYGQLKKTMQGLDMFDEDLPIAGSYTDSGNLRFPVEDTLQNRVQAGLFGQWASENARDYFDNEWKPLNEKQTQEFIDLDLPIRDYREIREGLSDFTKLADKADYIDSLDLPVSKKNLLINNIADRKEQIDLTTYDEYDSFEEFDYAQKNPEKYDFLTEYGISYSQYKSFDDDAKEEIDNAYSWVKNNPVKVTVSRAVTDNVLEYRQYTSALNDIRADKDSSGKTINGSAKAKKVEYINSLDLDYGAKLVLFKSEYNADDTYNGEIIEYIISREDFSYEDKVAILKELGFEVSSDGTVTW